jgi:parallel beta-helix repeat protein
VSDVCQAPSCDDGAVNQDEVDVDCGGSACDACADGAACLGGSDCTSAVCAGNVCQVASCSDSVQNQGEAAVDCGGAACVECGVNAAPLARIVVSPGAGTHDGTPTVFLGDSSGTTDREDAADQLAYAWDWENDGVTDDVGPTSTHSYGSEGTFEARLTVQDTGGLTATATFLVVVAAEGRVLRVTTAADEDDPNATPASPGGTGFSLREAIAFAEGAVDKQVVIVPAGFVIDLTGELPALTDGAGIDIIGDGAVIDGAGTAQVDDCLQVDSVQTRVFGLEIENCSRSPLRVSFVNGCQFSRLDLHDNGQAAFINGPGNTFGPGNIVSRSAEHGLTVFDDTIVVANEFHDNAERGIDLTGSSDGSLVIGNVLTGNNPGILFGAGASSNVVIHNTLHRNASDGIFVAGSGTSGTVLQNNIFSENVDFGLRTNDEPFFANDHNSYFSNGLGACSDCSSLGPGSSSSDPLFIDAVANDFRLAPASPNRDAGIDTGRDVNGPVPGNGLFNGSNPDIGARESP